MSVQPSPVSPLIAPVIPIRDGVVFPSTEVVLTFGRPRSVAGVEAAFAKNKLVIIVMQKTSTINEPDPDDLHTLGTLCQIDRVLKGDNEINALVRGVSRVKIINYLQNEPFLVAEAIPVPSILDTSDEIKALCNHLSAELRRAVNLGKAIDFLAFMNIMSGLNPDELSNQIAGIVDIKPHEKQVLLETIEVRARLEKITNHLAHELKVLEIEKKIASQTQEKFDKTMRDAVLKERLKTIEKELGEEGESKETKEFLEKIKKAKMPKEVEEKARKELKRLSQMSTYNPEASYLRTYLEWLTELPWSVSTEDAVDIGKAQEVLDGDHYGLNKIKERILEYLAVIKLRKIAQAQNQNTAQTPRASAPTILCFVGPPGVGKTSIGRSIARALNRKFVKISLGGIRDEAEIRGHRRTYVGSLPGRIIQGIKQAGSNNPVFMLDEIDKVGTDFRGDPSSALLEALDPEQNYAFSDHYLEMPFDLSGVMFITTANILDTVPPALRDRLEIIHFAGYTTDEKFRIASDYLIKKQLEAHGLTGEQASISSESLKIIISRYTREAGVRNLERQIATVFRKAARKIAGNGKYKVKVDAKNLHLFLGPYKFTSYLAEKKDEVGMSTGLAWTEAGGEIMFIEAALMPGRGNLTLTGQLGDVMKESGHAAMSYIRARWKKLNLPEKFYQKIDVHVHVPEGAVPKDGPSAGIAITTAIISSLTKIPVKRNVAMTGEITLRGRVLEIGGTKEKVIAAHRAGIKEVIMPKNNKKDLEDIAKYVVSDLRFHFVEHMDEVLKIALADPLKTESKKDNGKSYIHLHAHPPLPPS